MPTSFRSYPLGQGMLLPADLREWVPEDHLARQVGDLVDSLDLSAFYAPYEGDGRRNAPYEPSMMVKVLTCAYATGTFSSRRIARKIEEDIAFRMLAVGNFPQRRTACEFRRRHLDDFRALFVEVVRMARAMGLASFGALSVDGTKVRANASKRKAMSYERMQREEARLEGEVEGILAAALRADAEEDALHGEGVRGDEAPEALRGGERRLAAIRKARARLDAEAREAPPRPKTKPDATPAAPAPAAREAGPPRQGMKADVAAGQAETAAREPAVEPARQGMKADAAPAAPAPAAREAEPPRQEMKADTAPANREASGEPPRQGMKADADAGQAETAAREPAVEPARQGMQPDVAPAASEPAADPLLELRIRERRLETIRASKGRLEAAAWAADAGRKRRPAGRALGEPVPKAQSDSPHPESRIMKTSAEGFQPCCDAQLAVDEENRIVVAAHLGQGASDQNRLVPLPAGVKETFGVMPETALADAGYCNEAELVRLEERGVDTCVALARDGSKRPVADPVTCPATRRMAEKLATPEGKARYAQAQVALGGPERLDQGGDGLPALQRPGTGQGAGRVGLGLPRAERQADGAPGGRLTARQRKDPDGNPRLNGL